MANSKEVFVHEKAICDSPNVGEGTRIWDFSHVLKGARIGSNCNICAHVFIENRAVIGDNCTVKNGVTIWDEVRLEDGVFVGPNAAFTNDFRPRAFIKRGGTHFMPTLVKRGATIGANATIVCGITIGEFAMVGAGAVVTRDVPAHSLVVGNPARSIGKICFCGERLVKDDFCPVCEKKLSENSSEMAIKLLSKA
jgi:UDP-2-acetamido-3-amino-2,3-dideoxy-glucuronate N-acetyltransferase